jgi:hypothetical protein
MLYFLPPNGNQKRNRTIGQEKNCKIKDILDEKIHILINNNFVYPMGFTNGMKNYTTSHFQQGKYLIEL